MPALLVGRRRGLLVALAGMGFAQAALSVLTAFLTPQLLRGGSPLGLSALLIAAGLGVGAIRIGERVVSEELGQDFVRETRRLLVASALVPERSLNLGSTIARTTNDLSAVKNWVSLGISPIVVGVPLILGVVVAMFVLTPPFALVIVAVLALVAAIMFVLSGPLFRRARGLRKVRGRMAGYIADTVTAGEAIRVSGGVHREVKRVDKLSARVMEAARARAVISGAMRGSAASTTALLSVLVAVVGGSIGSSMADITTAVFISGMLAAPITDLGRVGEYRQNYNAARRVIDPVLHNARRHAAQERRLTREQARLEHHDNPVGMARDAVHIADLVDREGPIPELVAAPGARVLLVGESTKRTGRVLRDLVADHYDPEAWVSVAGRLVNALPARKRRDLVGVASRNVPIERGTVERVVRYRVPDSTEPASALLAKVGLTDAIAALPEGERTTLRRGGEPLTTDQRARLKLARAIAGDPPLLVLDHLDDQLAPAGRQMLRALLAEYAGCVILRSSDPEAILDSYDVWNVDELAPTTVIALPAHELAMRGPRSSTHVSGSGATPFGPPVRRSAVDRAAAHAEPERAERPDDDDEDE